jgi:hypothetical protein
MKKFFLIGLVLALVASGFGPAFAAPRLQTYIVDSKYHNVYNGRDIGTWITNRNQFDLKVVGYWASETTSGSGYLERPMFRQPAYDFMDCYLAMKVPTGQSGTIYINGVEISSFTNYFDAVPDGTSPSWLLPMSTPAPLFGSRYNFAGIGRIDNDQVNAWHYGHGSISSPGWGDEIMLNVVVRGFEWAHFDAIGVDSQGRTWTNEQWHDSSYYATPEPSTLGLLGIGLLGVAPLLRRRKH